MYTIITADEAVSLVKDGSTLLINPVPSEELFGAFGRVFEQTGKPEGLTVVFAAGLGPYSYSRRGMNHFAYAGMVKRVIAGHVGLNYALARLIADDEIEAYNLPQGVLCQLYREIAAHRIGVITQVGLGTFVDPRVDGGKMNARTRPCEDLVELIQLDGREHLWYKAFPVHTGLVRGTTVDPAGNITVEDEAITMEALEVAMAVKNCGGTVIAQVARVSDKPAHPQHVKIPGIFIDYVVVAQSAKTHPHTLFVEHDASYTGETLACLEKELESMPLNCEKIISRRAAFELRKGMKVNLGVGIPMGIASVACEERILNDITLTTEVGAVGGLPARGFNFGPARNPSAFLSQPQMFDFYAGGGLDITCVGLAQTDEQGNVNVSRIGSRVIGCGGFIDITQSARKCLFCGEFTTGGLEVFAGGGALSIRKEGKTRKFVKAVQQITFSGPFAKERNKEVLFITERCVFRLMPEGLMLVEIAPGVDLQRDILDQMEFAPIVPAHVAMMDPAIFREELVGLAR